MIGRCRLCDHERSLIDAHIIAEVWFRRLARFGGINRILKEVEYPKRARSGIYDSGILCAECDGVFSPWENYAQELLNFELSHFQPVLSNGAPVAFTCEIFDYSKLKLFFISLLWRASISTHPFFQKVDIGPYEARAKALISAKDPGDPMEFGVLLQKFDDEAGQPIFDPVPIRINGVRLYRFYLGGYVIHIKVSAAQFSDPLSEVAMRPDKPLIVMPKEFMRSQEREVFNSIRRAPQNIQRRRRE
jgi:hypothetical protein